MALFSLLSSPLPWPPTQSWGDRLGHSLWTVLVLARGKNSQAGRLEDKSEYLLQPVATIPRPCITLQPCLSPRGCQGKVPAACWPPGGLLLFLKECRGWGWGLNPDLLFYSWGGMQAGLDQGPIFPDWDCLPFIWTAASSWSFQGSFAMQTASFKWHIRH